MQSVVRLSNGTIWYNSNVVGGFFFLEEANIRVLQCSETSYEREMGDIRCELGLHLFSQFFLLIKSFYLYMYCLGIK